MKFKLIEPKFLLNEKYKLVEAEEGKKEFTIPNPDINKLTTTANNLKKLAEDADAMSLLKDIKFDNADNEKLAAQLPNAAWATLVNIAEKYTKSSNGEKDIVSAATKAISYIESNANDDMKKFFNTFISNSTGGRFTSSKDLQEYVNSISTNIASLKEKVDSIKNLSKDKAVAQSAANGLSDQFTKEFRELLRQIIEDSKELNIVLEKVAAIGHAFEVLKENLENDDLKDSLIDNSMKCIKQSQKITELSKNKKFIESVKADVLSNYTEILKNVNKTTKAINDKIKSFTDELTNISDNEKTNSFNALNNSVVALAQEAIKLNSELEAEIKVLTEIANSFDAANAADSAKEEEDWESKMQQAIDSDNIDKAMQEYWTNYWQGYDLKTLKSISVTLTEELKLGYTAEQNPFISYLKTILNNSAISKSLQTNPEIYDAIHDAVLEKKINTNTLRSKNSANIIFNEDFFTKSYTDGKQYLTLQDRLETIWKKAVKNTGTDFKNTDLYNLLNTKYGQAEVDDYTISNFTIDVLYEPGNPFDSNQNRTDTNSGNPITGKLHNTEYINKVINQTFTETAIANAVADENNKMKKDITSKNKNQLLKAIEQKITEKYTDYNERRNYAISFMAAITKILEANGGISLNAVRQDSKTAKIDGSADMIKAIELLHSSTMQSDQNAKTFLDENLAEYNILSLAKTSALAIELIQDIMKIVLKFKPEKAGKKKKSDKPSLSED